MQNSSLVQLKIKANEFIEQYERQISQKDYQKQKLKQNIMLEIMSNRHKSQVSQSIQGNDIDRFDDITQESKFKRSNVYVSKEEKNKTNNNSLYLRSNSVPNTHQINALQSEQEHESSGKLLQGAEITFKMSKKRPGFDQDSENRQQSEFEKLQNSMNRINGQQRQNYLDEDHTLRDNKSKINKTTEQMKSNSNIVKISQRKDNVKENQHSQKNKNKSHKYEQEEEEDGSEKGKDQYEQNEEISEEIEEPEVTGAIFLTVDEDQSVQVSQEKKNKNYAFDILMNKSEPIQDIDELRKRKIEQMERKRFQRMEEFRKQQQAKKLLNQEKETKRSISISKANNKSSANQYQQKNFEESEIESSKSRNKKKPYEREEKNTSYNHIPPQQSNYNMRPPQPHRASYIAPIEKQKNDYDYHQASYQQTPKTINSSNRGDKSRGKNTIFRESPQRPDKSASKYSQQPKIQPKERKNTFNKQSNKKLMITALNNTCLPGQLNRKQRQKLSQVLERESAEFFVFLFKQYSRKVIKGIYILDVSQAFLQKIYGDKAPQEIFPESVQGFYRFDSGSRQFKKLDGCKSFSLVVHAIDLA